MSTDSPTCPATRQRVVELYFMEHRAKLIDIAAFLDRLDRATAGSEEGCDDFRIAAFREAVRILSDAAPGRAKRVLELFSDYSTEPIDSAAGLKGAFGAVPPAESGGSS